MEVEVDVNRWCWYCVNDIKHSARDHEHERQRRKVEEELERRISKEKKR